MIPLRSIREAVTDHRLYHNTSIIGLEGIMHYQAVGRTSTLKDNRLVWVKDMASGKYIAPKLFSGWVSFTRDQRYQSAPGSYEAREVRLVFDGEILRQRHKTRPTRGIVAPANDPDGALVGAAARWESEELVMGPIPLKDGMLEIQMTTKAHDKLLDTKAKYTVFFKQQIASPLYTSTASAQSWLKYIAGINKILHHPKLTVGTI